MFCLNCGNQLSDKEQFCSQCGTPIQQSETQSYPDETEIAAESGSESLSEADISSQAEEVGQAESADIEENAPRLYQEPISDLPDTRGLETASVPVPVQTPTPQPQYQQQAVNPPQYWQAPVQPNQPPAAAAISTALPPIPPFMKRKKYFKSPAAEKIKGKIDLLSFFTGMGLGVILIFAVYFLILLFEAIYTANILPDRYNSVDTERMMTVSIVGLSISAVFALLCILGTKTKHFGFYIPLMFPSLCLTGIMIYALIEFNKVSTVAFSTITFFDPASPETLIFALWIILAAVAGLSLILAVLSLVFSIIISSSYKKAQREYIWQAVNRNVQNNLAK